MRYIAILIMMTFLAMPVFAQGATFTRDLKRLNEINSYNPEQSTRHLRSRDVLDDRIVDSTNRVVGSVKDLLLNKSGFIEMINADFSRLSLGRQGLFVSFDDLDIARSSSSYKMGYSDDELESMLPDLLGEIKTASGSGEEAYSVRKIVGATIKDAKGRKLGTVRDVLFDSKGLRAEILFVGLNYKSLRGETIAVPFRSGDYAFKRGKLHVEVSVSMADAMLSYAEDND